MPLIQKHPRGNRTSEVMLPPGPGARPEEGALAARRRRPEPAGGCRSL